MKVAQSCPTLWTHRPYSLWNSPGQNTGAGSLFLPQGIFSTQGSNPGLRHVRQILYQVNHKGSPQLKINKFNYKRKFLCRIHTWNIVNVQHLLLLNWVQKMRHNWIQWVAKTSQAMADVEPEPRSYFSQARACFFLQYVLRQWDRGSITLEASALFLRALCSVSHRWAVHSLLAVCGMGSLCKKMSERSSQLQKAKKRKM